MGGRIYTIKSHLGLINSSKQWMESSSKTVRITVISSLISRCISMSLFQFSCSSKAYACGLSLANAVVREEYSIIPQCCLVSQASVETPMRANHPSLCPERYSALVYPNELGAVLDPCDCQVETTSRPVSDNFPNMNPEALELGNWCRSNSSHIHYLDVHCRPGSDSHVWISYVSAIKLNLMEMAE